MLFSLCLFSAAPAQVEKLLNKAAAGERVQHRMRVWGLLGFGGLVKSIFLEPSLFGAGLKMK